MPFVEGSSIDITFNPTLTRSLILEQNLYRNTSSKGTHTLTESRLSHLDYIGR